MKGSTTLIIFFILFQNGYSQISSTIPIKKGEAKISIYDSLSNDLKENVQMYVGQTLYLKGKVKSSQSYGYRNIMSKPFLASRNMDYERVAEKYFMVDKVIPCDYFFQSENFCENIYFLKLINKSSNDTVYYKYNLDPSYTEKFPFIVVGYYEKLKKRFVGNEYFLRYRNYTDIETGEEILSTIDETWELVDITIDEIEKELRVVFQNKKGNKRMEGLYYLEDDYFKYDIPTALSYQKKFGKAVWNEILDGEIRIGFTTEMVILSWGEPKSINRASYGDQWVYENSYLYFENGKLKSYN